MGNDRTFGKKSVYSVSYQIPSLAVIGLWKEFRKGSKIQQKR